MIKNGTSLHNVSLSGKDETTRFSNTLSLVAGDIIDFAVGSSNTYLDDSTSLKLTISSLSIDPEIRDTGVINFTDVDLSDSHTVTATPKSEGYLGTFNVLVSDASMGDGTGTVTWNFGVLDSVLDYLAEGQTLTQIYTITVNDGKGGTTSEDVTITLTGSKDRAIITGTSSNDSINGTVDSEIIDGGEGVDRVNYGSSTAGVIVNLITGEGSSGYAEGDIIFNIEKITGSGYDDEFTGNNEQNFFYAGNGNDVVKAGDGGAYIYGENGHDTLTGGAGLDRIYGQSGNDVLSGGAEEDILKGWTGDDDLTGNAGDDLLYGDAGVDTLNGTDDTNLGVGEIDILYGGSQSDLFILGNTTASYYDDGDNLLNGIGDYARIRDFNVTEDTIQLFGGETYYLGSSPAGVQPGTGIYIDNDGSVGLTSQDELIGLLEGGTLSNAKITGATQGFSLVS